ncbi:hypothetical protein [Burkholderia sp. S-53]|uniref:hypothetical protein n=1 Tax=Burkholderia sp. S-53 TaxID=2906514 RepID=UPI0021CEF853|nr:hypothetical protein [Burkholderia sp. S-53]UXU86486.1 hypothetical protein LXM88_14985 [Burkholderia sp. S-53]
MFKESNQDAVVRVIEAYLVANDDYAHNVKPILARGRKKFSYYGGGYGVMMDAIVYVALFSDLIKELFFYEFTQMVMEYLTIYNFLEIVRDLYFMDFLPRQRT